NPTLFGGPYPPGISGGSPRDGPDHRRFPARIARRSPANLLPSHSAPANPFYRQHPANSAGRHRAGLSNSQISSRFAPACSFPILVAAVLAHPILDVVADDEIERLVGEAVVLRQHSVDFVNDGLV